MCRKEVQPYLALCNFFWWYGDGKKTLLFPDDNHGVLLSNMEYLYLATKIFVVLSQKSWLSINATCWNYHQSFLNPPKYFVTMITLLQVGERWRRLQPRKSKWKSRKLFLFTKLFWRRLQVNDNNREPLVEEEDAIAAGFAHEAQALLPPGANPTVSLSQPPHLGHNAI